MHEFTLREYLRLIKEYKRQQAIKILLKNMHTKR